MQAFSPPSSTRKYFSHQVNPHLSHGEKKNQTPLIIVGILIVLVTIVTIISLRRGDGTNELILNIIGLRKAPTDVVKKSVLITQTNEMVKRFGNSRIKNEWEGLADCMKKGCTDVDYYNFLITVITQKKVAHGELLYNLILVNKYWGTSEIIDFSQSTTVVNKEVENLGSREVSKKWIEIIQCDGKCQEKDDLFFQMIKMVVMSD